MEEFYREHLINPQSSFVQVKDSTVYSKTNQVQGGRMFQVDQRQDQQS